MNARPAASGAAVLLDRDGVLNRDLGYVHRLADWQWLDGAVEALKRLKAAGYRLFVVTNQSGIARGLYRQVDVERLHAAVNRQLAAAGCAVEAFYLCPHHPDHGERLDCDCRKPRPGLVQRALREHNLDPATSWMIGDRPTDLAAGSAAGLRTVGIGERTRDQPAGWHAADLAAAATWILSQQEAAV